MNLAAFKTCCDDAQRVRNDPLRIKVRNCWFADTRGVFGSVFREGAFTLMGLQRNNVCGRSSAVAPINRPFSIWYSALQGFGLRKLFLSDSGERRDLYCNRPFLEIGARKRWEVSERLISLRASPMHEMCDD